jgi:hypothetical protein
MDSTLKKKGSTITLNFKKIYLTEIPIYNFIIDFFLKYYISLRDLQLFK